MAVTLRPGPDWVDAILAVWADGDAIAPIDSRAPAAHVDRLLAMLAPGALVGVDGERRSLDGGRPVEEGDALVMPTSGTSAAPKGVVLTHEAIAFAADSSNAVIDPDGDAHWLACLPLHHIGGFSVITRALRTGTRPEVHDGFDADRVRLAAAAGCTHTSLVPTTLGRIDPSWFRLILVGGSAIPTDRPANCVATYGMTESCAGVVYDGRPLPGVDLRIADPAPNGIGAIELRSPGLFRCYRDGSRPIDADGWFRTADVGSIDADGLLSVAGRADDVIITGGENIWPEEVERVLRTHVGVADVAIIGRPDGEWGQVVTAVVIPVDPAAPPSLASLRHFARGFLPAAAVPRALELVAELPTTNLGKIRRASLRDRG